MQIGTGRDPPRKRTRERRLVRIDGAPTRPNGLAERLAVLWLTPQMDRLFLEANRRAGASSTGWCSASIPAMPAGWRL